MLTTIETTILKNLVHNEDYMRKVFPFLKDAYFTNTPDKLVYGLVKSFIEKYNKTPTVEALEIALFNSGTQEALFKEASDILKELGKYEKSDMQWLVDETEKFCKDKAVYNAILQSIGIMEGRDKNVTKDGIPSLLQEALGVCFDDSIGHNYFDDHSERFDFYNRIETRIPFDIELLNKVTKGGLPNKTLNVALAGCVHPETKIQVRIRKK